MLRLTFTLISALFLCNAVAQDSSWVRNEIQGLTSIYEEYEKHLETFGTSTNLSALKSISTLEEKKDTNHWNQRETEERIKLLKREIGLTGTAGFVQNLSPNVDAIEENVIYQRRLQLGVEWDFLKHGFTQNYFKRKALENQLLFDKIKDENGKNTSGFVKQMSEVITFFNFRKTNVLANRAKYMNESDSLIKNLFLLKQIRHEDFIDVQSRRAEIKGMQAIYDDYNKFALLDIDSVKNLPIPLIDVNYPLLGKLIDKNDTIFSQQPDFYQISDLRNKWWNEIGAKLYARYNLYDLVQTDPATRSFFSIGLNIRVPLIFNHKIKRNIDEIKFQQQYDNLQALNTHEKEVILNLVYEFRYKLKQYISVYQKRLLFEELLRKEHVKLEFEDADFNPIKGINLIDDLMRIDIELLDLLQNLYIKALRINFKLENDKIEHLFMPFNLPQINMEENEIQKNTFIWSKTIDTNSLVFLKEYVAYNKFKNIFVAGAPQDKYLAKKKELISKTKSKVHLMVGNNNLIHDPNPEKYVNDILSQYDSLDIKGIHLDVEPHTFDDYKENKSDYLNKYKLMIYKIVQNVDTSKYKISISIPLHYDTTIVNDIFEKIHYVDFMCYENVKESYLLRKLAPYSKHSAKIGISIRTEDFDNKIKMLQFGVNICKLANVKRLNIHSLGRLIRMDEQYLNID